VPNAFLKSGLAAMSTATSLSSRIGGHFGLLDAPTGMLTATVAKKNARRSRFVSRMRHLALCRRSASSLAAKTSQRQKRNRSIASGRMKG
jgi:hypothetical protein